MNKTKKLEEYFYDLRFKDESHLGLGDIRLTLAQQDEIVCMVLDILEKEERTIIDKIIETMAAYEVVTGIKPKYIYLGSNTIWEVYKVLGNGHNINITNEFICGFFNVTEVFTVNKKEHINVC